MAVSQIPSPEHPDVPEWGALDSGSGQRFEELFEPHRRAIYSMLLGKTKNREVALDLTQETAVRCCRALDSWDTTRPFKSWAMKIASNIFLDHLRKIGRRVEECSFSQPLQSSEGSDLFAAETFPDSRPTILDELVASEEILGVPREYLYVMVSELPADQRLVVEGVLRGQKLIEIAEENEVKLGTVRSRLHRAIRSMRLQASAGELVPTAA